MALFGCDSANNDGRTTSPSFSLRFTIQQQPTCLLTEAVFGPKDALVTASLPANTACASMNIAAKLDDFDFDGRMDVSVVDLIPASNPPVYKYWLQQPDGHMSSSAALNDADL